MHYYEFLIHLVMVNGPINSSRDLDCGHDFVITAIIILPLSASFNLRDKASPHSKYNFRSCQP